MPSLHHPFSFRLILYETRLIPASLALHGLCYVCFFTASYIYVDQAAEPEIRASAQGLITFVLLGAGLVVGSWFAGFVSDAFTIVNASGIKTVDYTKIFLVPLGLTVFCAALFVVFFRPRKAA